MTSSPQLQQSLALTALDPDVASIPLLYLAKPLYQPVSFNGVLQGSPGQWTKFSDLLDNIQRGPWFEIHRNFVSYVLDTLKFFDGPLNEITELSKQWAERDRLTSLANYRSVVQILFGYLKDSQNLRGAGINVYTQLSEDLSSVLRQMNSILSDRATYRQFLNCRGDVAQQLLDLLQDLLDSSHGLASEALLSKALLRLSGECGLHPTCFTLNGLEKIGQQVAGGGFGDIWKGWVGGQTVAVKSLRQFTDDDVTASLKKLGREALIWRQLSHPNLLPFFGLYMLDSRLCLVSPWMDNGDLKHFLSKAPSGVDRVSLIVDVAMGLDYLHSKHIVHGDLKTPNILVTPSRRACITDFGLSSIVDDLSMKMTFSSRSGRPGTVRYQAPELLKNECPNHFGSDVYAFACILTGKLPFFEILNEARVIYKVTVEGARPSRVEAISLELWLLLSDSWHENVNQRPEAATILLRLLNEPIGQEIRESPPDWDDTYSARFRRSVQEWPLLPSIAEIEQKAPVWDLVSKKGSFGPPMERDRGQLGMQTSSSRRNFGAGVGQRIPSMTAMEQPTFSSLHEVTAGSSSSSSSSSAERSPKPALAAPPVASTESGEATQQQGPNTVMSAAKMSSQTATFRRPMRRRTATPDIKALENIDVVPPISVLIVEDNVVNQMQLAKFMQKKKLKFQIANNGLEAVEKWKTGNFDLILMDIQMPVMDGIDATKEIRRLERMNAAEGYPPTSPSSIPSPNSATSTRSATSPYISGASPYHSSVIIVAQTASSLNSDRVKALAAGCNDFLTKPVNHHWLNNKLTEWGSIKALQMWANMPPPGGR
ncbi:kinase-like domain-containing protein [Mycena galopus ATCC 62051]|nr:kinase-like domain-containing protein [Mycena galopus ATCC 62051]